MAGKHTRKIPSGVRARGSGGGLSNNPNPPWQERPDLVAKCFRIFTAHVRDHETYVEIAEKEGCTTITVWNYIKRAQKLLSQMTYKTLDDIRFEAIFKRQALQSIAIKDHGTALGADAGGRAGLLRFVGDQQTSVEELQGVRVQRGAEAPQLQPIVIAVGGVQKSIGELSDDEISQLEQRLAQLTNGEAVELDD